VSTDTSRADDRAAVDPDAVYRLHPSVSLRPERFGALAYSFDTRKLSFLKHPDLVAAVESFDGTRTVGAALEHVGVDRGRWPSFLAALATLERSEMITPMEVHGVA
jgi:putative mycofactocin binding protein MftB